MTWVVEFQPQKDRVGTLVLSYAGAQPVDAWQTQFSIDLSIVKTLDGYAEKAKAMKAQADTERTKVPDYQPLLDGLAAALNAGEKT